MMNQGKNTKNIREKFIWILLVTGIVLTIMGFEVVTHYGRDGCFETADVVRLSGWLGIALFCVFCIRKYMRQRTEHMHMIRSVSSVFSVFMMLDLEHDCWEIVKVPENINGLFEEGQSISEMLKRFCEQSAVPKQWEMYLEFLNMATLAKRLEEKEYLNFETEDINGEWYKTLLVPERFDDAGNVQQVVLLRQTITAEKKLERDYQTRLKEADELAQQADIAKTDFLRRMSHDFRTPINAICGMAEICRHYSDNPQKVEECLDKIMESSKFLMIRVDDILNMNKLESGQLSEEKTAISMTETMQEITFAIRSIAQEHGISFFVENQGVVHDNLWGSALYFRQILENILINAIKYNKENGSVRLCYREEKSDETCARFEFICEDTGKGMSKEFQPRAFEAFAQENISARTVYEGTGLGLTLAEKLTKQMGGEISFVSEAGIGTTFTLKLPFEIDFESAEKLQEEEETENISMKGLKVLLAEDNMINMEIAQFILEDEGAEVTEAWNGKEALEQFQQSAPGEFDLILMDLMMPVMGGLEAVRCIRSLEREDAKQIPIIAITANAFADDVERCLEAGMDAHIAKPIDAKKMIAVINEKCQKPKK